MEASLSVSKTLAVTITSSALRISLTSTTSSLPTFVSSAVTSGKYSDCFSSAVAISAKLAASCTTLVSCSTTCVGVKL